MSDLFIQRTRNDECVKMWVVKSNVESSRVVNGMRFSIFSVSTERQGCMRGLVTFGHFQTGCSYTFVPAGGVKVISLKASCQKARHVICLKKK